MKTIEVNKNVTIKVSEKSYSYYYYLIHSKDKERNSIVINQDTKEKNLINLIRFFCL